MSGAPAQLPLALSHPPHYGRESFLPAPSNRVALGLVERWPAWAAPVVVLSGPPGSGKTHLAQIWAERAGAGLISAAELRSPALLRSAPGNLALEDVPTRSIPERELFHLINRAREAGASLLLTARAPAAEWSVELPDLRSRLRLSTPVALESPDDDLLRQVLVKLFADRQLVVEKSVADYLLLRTERSLAAVARLVAALDRQALASGRRITRRLAARVLQDVADEDDGFSSPR